MKFKSSFIVFISLRLSSLSVAVLAAPVVQKTTTTSEQQEQSSSSTTTGSHEDLQYPAVNKGTLKDVSASVPGDANHIAAGDQDVTVTSNGSPRNLGAPSTEVSVKGTAGGDVAAQRGGPEETDAGVHTSSDINKLKDLGKVSSGGLISHVHNQSTEKTAEPEHPHSHDDSEVTSTVNRSRHLLTSQNDAFLGTDKAQWMTALASKLGSNTANVYLKDFVLPGSHNSAAVNMHRRYCDLGNAFIEQSQRNRAAKCQEKGILDQLNEGIRYLDIRAVNNDDFDIKAVNDEEFVIGSGMEYPLVHGFIVDDPVNTMEKALDTIVDFLDANSGEFVVARIKTYDCNEISGNISWRTKFDDIVTKHQNKVEIKKYNYTHLDDSMNNLKGKLFVDIWDEHRELYQEGIGVGVGGQENSYKPHDGNPFEIAENIHNTINNGASSYHNDPTRFNIWSFFPAPTVIEAALPIGGIEQWDKNFQNNNWLMHTLVAHIGENVNVILRDYATEGKNIYHTATQLTLYRIFDRNPNIIRNKNVATLETVNAYDGKFEHRCPVGWILGGMSSSHWNRKEDRLWKFKCVKKGWLESESEYYEDGDYGNSNKVKSDINEDILTRNGEKNVETELDALWSIGDNTCNRAITGLGSTAHSVQYTYKQDRKFYHYSSKVKGNHSSNCKWTPKWRNEFDKDLDYQLSRKNKYIGMIQSEHNNRKEDRRFKFCICTKR